MAQKLRNILSISKRFWLYKEVVKILSSTPYVVHVETAHTSSNEEMVPMKKHPEVIVRCVGDKKEPSKAAVDRFIAIYLDAVKDIKKEA